MNNFLQIYEFFLVMRKIFLFDVNINMYVRKTGNFFLFILK